MSAPKKLPRMIGVAAHSSLNNRFEFSSVGGFRIPNLSGVEYLSLTESEALVRAARIETDDWKAAFRSAIQYIPDTYGDEQAHAARIILQEMERKKKCRESWEPKAREEGGERERY